ncbi:hypothetical protein GE061_011784 [Apolygus lucorum]|uniref:Uncharacterized protein n=1 Tax=Apolygus lucorum TaxID=248454 RepID=A0A8S9XYS2_APOLU|nr:hypothetical protein GE061_011784 [Apolygus lucorum]
MSHAVVLCLALLASASAQIRDDGDDGSYNVEKYEKPYEYSAIYEQEQQPQSYQPQPQAYQPQQQAYQPQQYQPQPQAYQPQPQAYQQPQYQPQPQAPVYRPAPQTYNRPVTDSKNAAILSEARYLQNDGKFGASYTQEDGVEFKEESDPDGTRRGTYSYVDPSGQRRTVSYTAGKGGFVASGDHLPVGPAPVPAAPAPQAYQPAPAARAYQPQPQTYQPQPQTYQPQARSQGPQIGLTVDNGGYQYNSHF